VCVRVYVAGSFWAEERAFALAALCVCGCWARGVGGLSGAGDCMSQCVRVCVRVWQWQCVSMAAGLLVGQGVSVAAGRAP
jgi:hypothetical protein